MGQKVVTGPCPGPLYLPPPSSRGNAQGRVKECRLTPVWPHPEAAQVNISEVQREEAGETSSRAQRQSQAAQLGLTRDLGLSLGSAVDSL